MAIEKIETKLNSPEIYTNGVETPVVVENIPVSEQATDLATGPQKDPKEEALKKSLTDAVLKGKVGYDSPEIKRKVLTSSATEAQSWNSIMGNKVQREEIQNL